MAMAAWLGRREWWGLHSLAYVPGWLAIPLVAGALVACFWLMRRDASTAVLARPLRPGTPAELLFVGTAAALAFWALRVRHLMLGDGLPMVASAGVAFRLHPLEPLASLVQHGWVRLLAPVFAGRGYQEFYADWYALAMGSAVSGGVFVVLAYGIAREWERSGPAGAASSSGPTVLSWAAAALLVLQGYGLLFFGYVENYGILLLSMAAYVYAAMRHLNGRGRLVTCAIAMAVAIALHLSALMLVPSFAALAARRRERAPRADLVAAGIVLLLAALGATLVFARLAPGYSFTGEIRDVVASLLAQRLGRGPDAVALINVILLAGPVGALLFAGFLFRARVAAHAADRWWFASTLGLGALASLLMAGPSNLGYARNWDLLAPVGFLVLVAGIMLLHLGEGRTRVGAWLAAMLVVSVVHVVPWVAANADEQAAIRRMADLPLGGGRAESTIGYWQLIRGRPADARTWFERAVAAAPSNLRARLFLGELLLEGGRPGEAEGHLRVARRLRPDLAIVRALLAKSMWMRGQRLAAQMELAEVAADSLLPATIRRQANAVMTALNGPGDGGATDHDWSALIGALRSGAVR